MTLKLWLLSIIAPHIFKHKKETPKNNTNYQPG